MAIRDVKIISVPVHDQERAKAFYLERLDFEIARYAPDLIAPGQSWIAVRPKGGRCILSLVNFFDSMPAGSLRGLTFEVDDVDAEQARLLSEGVDVDPVITEAWGRFFEMRDSEGNRLLLQTSAPAPTVS